MESVPLLRERQSRGCSAADEHFALTPQALGGAHAIIMRRHDRLAPIGEWRLRGTCCATPQLFFLSTRVSGNRPTVKAGVSS